MPRSAQASEFARQADQRQAGMLGEMVAFLRHNKKWWLIPIVVVLLLVGLFLVLGGIRRGPLHLHAVLGSSPGSRHARQHDLAAGPACHQGQ